MNHKLVAKFYLFLKSNSLVELKPQVNLNKLTQAGVPRYFFKDICDKTIFLLGVGRYVAIFNHAWQILGITVK